MRLLLYAVVLAVTPAQDHTGDADNRIAHAQGVSATDQDGFIYTENQLTGEGQLFDKFLDNTKQFNKDIGAGEQRSNTRLSDFTNSVSRLRQGQVYQALNGDYELTNNQEGARLWNPSSDDSVDDSVEGPPPPPPAWTARAGAEKTDENNLKKAVDYLSNIIHPEFPNDFSPPLSEASWAADPKVGTNLGDEADKGLRAVSNQQGHWNDGKWIPKGVEQNYTTKALAETNAIDTTLADISDASDDQIDDQADGGLIPFLNYIEDEASMNQDKYISQGHLLADNYEDLMETITDELAAQELAFASGIEKQKLKLDTNRESQELKLQMAIDGHSADWDYIREQIEELQAAEDEFTEGPNSYGVTKRKISQDINDIRLALMVNKGNMKREAAEIMRSSKAAMRKLGKEGEKILQGVFQDHNVATRFAKQAVGEIKKEKQNVISAHRMLKSLAKRIKKMELKAFADLESAVRSQEGQATRMLEQADTENEARQLETFDTVIGKGTGSGGKDDKAMKKFDELSDEIGSYKKVVANSNKELLEHFTTFVTQKADVMRKDLETHNKAMYSKYHDQVVLALSEANMLAKRMLNNFNRLDKMILSQVETSDTGGEGALWGRVSELRTKLMLDMSKLTSPGNTDATTIEAQALNLPGYVTQKLQTSKDQMETAGKALDIVQQAERKAADRVRIAGEDEQELNEHVSETQGGFKDQLEDAVKILDQMVTTHQHDVGDALVVLRRTFESQLGELDTDVKHLEEALEYIEDTSIKNLYSKIDTLVSVNMQGADGNGGFLFFAKQARDKLFDMQSDTSKSITATTKAMHDGLTQFVTQQIDSIQEAEDALQGEAKRSSAADATQFQRAMDQMDHKSATLDDQSTELYKTQSEGKNLQNEWSAQKELLQTDVKRAENNFVTANDHISKSLERGAARFEKDLKGLGVPGDFTRKTSQKIEDYKRNLDDLRELGIENMEHHLEKWDDGIYQPTQDLDRFQRVFDTVSTGYSHAQIANTQKAAALFRQVDDINRGMSTQNLVDAKSESERMAILDKRTAELQKALDKKKDSMMAAEYAAAQQAINTAHAEMEAVIKDSDRWTKAQTEAIQAAEDKMFANNGALAHDALNVMEAAEHLADSDAAKQSHLLKDLVGFTGDVGLTHTEEKVETKTAQEQANEEFSSRVEAVSQAMNIIEDELGPQIQANIQRLQERWNQGLQSWQKRDSTMFAPETAKLEQLKESIQHDLRTMRNALMPMTARYNTYGDLVEQKKAEATEQVKTFKDKLATESTEFADQAKHISAEAESRILLIADEIARIAGSLGNVVDHAQETVDDGKNRSAHYGDVEDRMLGLKFAGEVDELKRVVADVQSADAEHLLLSKRAHRRDARDHAWRKIVEKKLQSLGVDVSEMQSAISTDSSLAARQLRRAGRALEDEAREAMTEEEKRMDGQIKAVYAQSDVLIARLEANENMNVAERAKAIAEAKADREARVREIMLKAEQAKSAERAAAAEAERYKQSVANVVNSLELKTGGMGGSQDVSNRTAAAVAEAANHVHQLSLSPALAPESLVDISAQSFTEQSTRQLEQANRELAAEDIELKAQLDLLRSKYDV